jgi:hypothetical protein
MSLQNSKLEVREDLQLPENHSHRDKIMVAFTTSSEVTVVVQSAMNHEETIDFKC